ncbi:GyrI-like domain-containing protein [Arthrobacter sp. CAN_A1]|uniref:GyrI-like domain-containing protein n=1 Tax=Arthrobacter sp. CAN_A1 TaxID=2787717 RepID=UPI001A238BA9
MKHRIVEKDELLLVGFKTRIPMVHDGPNLAIQEFERGLDSAAKDRLSELSEGDPAGRLSVTGSIDAQRSDGSDVDYWHAVATTQPVPDEFESLKVPAGLWVVFEAEGKFPESLQHLWADAATEWFPANPYRWAPGPEMLSVQPAPGGAGGRGQLWIPIEASWSSASQPN